MLELVMKNLVRRRDIEFMSMAFVLAGNLLMARYRHSKTILMMLSCKKRLVHSLCHLSDLCVVTFLWQCTGYDWSCMENNMII